MSTSLNQMPWKQDGRQFFWRAFWCFPQSVEAFRHCRLLLSIDGTFLLGKYMGTLLVAIACDADNALVPLAFALVERENKDSWGWFLRLVRIHVIGPGREVGVISDRHQGILSAVQEQIPGYAHCTTVTALVISPRICLTKITLRITLSYLSWWLVSWRCNSFRSSWRS